MSGSETVLEQAVGEGKQEVGKGRQEAARRLPLYALLVTHAISLMGNQITQIAIPWLVLQTTGNAALTGVVAFFQTIPLIVATFFGGTIIDRVGYRRVSMLADMASGVTLACIPLFYAMQGLGFWWLLALIFLGAFLDTPGLTAREAMLPEIAGQAKVRLERVNAIYETIQGGASLLGPALAGLLIAFFGSVNVLWFTAVGFAICALIIMVAIPRATVKHEKPYTMEAYVKDLRMGLRFAFGERFIRYLVILGTLMIFFYVPFFAVILPTYMQRMYGDANYLGWLLSSMGVGALVGALLYAVLVKYVSQRLMFLGSFMLMSIGFVVMAMLPAYPILLAAALVSGIAQGPVNPIINTVLQKRIPSTMRASVLGTVTGLSLLAAPLSLVVSGFTIEYLGLQVTLIAIAVGIVVVSVSTIVQPELRELDEETKG